ncbi:DUF2333 family protein [Pseudochrobactrum algeriensis]|uniref:DUF2333 family protein n=1 Tax=Pseudochrobactrum algeriensis TaxID=2834768 RepID=UPI001BCD972D|nr:DUF2333 family protein [Pseudochrobactrum algeriensis]MBX8811561.1 DUF2333 family protein [Ochrobactrum sp. MR34]QVQ38480.1 DUF2333 family protein [Pseudochrobactrum algeriensis]QVQ41696.1 DUF2333 family protein [Pseudochrobactrum algeriensis]QVQ45625.1 DUF2333 family protein [Pseudochrobactrum algeriensis]
MIAALLRLIAVPFGALWRVYQSLSVLWKTLIAVAVIGWAGLYGYFVVQTQVWTNFDPDYPAKYAYQSAVTPGEIVEPSKALTPPAAPSPSSAESTSPANPTALPAEGATGNTDSTTNNAAPSTEPASQQPAPQMALSQPAGARVCAPSALAEVTAELTDFNVNQNAWVSSMLFYKTGFFGLDWDRTPFLDNKASFQRGVHSAVRRTTIELVDSLGRLRGTSQIDNDLQKARGNMQFREDTWYFGLSPFGPKTPTPSYYRSAIKELRAFNARLEKCEATFDARADNLIQYVDRIASDLGSTSAILKDRSDNYHAGWFDTRADDRFWFAYGQLYAYYGLIRATHSDFKAVLAEKHLDGLWDTMEQQLRSALDMQPTIVSNGRQDAWFTPSHLTTMGFHILRVRSNLVDIRQVLER